ncbi:MAG TPA: hypothetical protein VFD59_08770 [Nocardioidaceae bacterium]|nr:hypothetical protein [Nocardioidaceae bacterium]
MTLTAANAHGELIEQLDARVREIVRAEAVDPQRDAVLVRRIAEGVVRAHDDRSLTGGVAPVPDTDAVVGELVARVAGFRPLQPFLDDAAVEEIWINDPSRVFVARRGRHELTNLMLTTAQVNELVERMLKSSGLSFPSPSVENRQSSRDPADVRRWVVQSAARSKVVGRDWVGPERIWLLPRGSPGVHQSQRADPVAQRRGAAGPSHDRASIRCIPVPEFSAEVSG